MISQVLHSWQPFKIDALGLVTLLGASDMDRSIGRLSRYLYLEFMPLLGAFVISSNDITKPLPGFTLYNATDGIMANDIAAWFGRWIRSEKFSWNSSCLHLSAAQSPPKKSRHIHTSIALMIAVMVMSITAALTIITDDWWGLANVISMILSIISRRIIITENLKGLDAAYEKISEETWAKKYKTALLISPDGKAITLFAPCGIITDVLLSNPKSPSPGLYFSARVVGWVGFSLHVISLGMSLLVNQLITVVLLIVPTILVANGVACDTAYIGSHIRIDRYDELTGVDGRGRAYLRMDLSQTEEEAMLAWALFPQRSNLGWWARYEKKTAETGREEFDNWKRSFQTWHG